MRSRGRGGRSRRMAVLQPDQRFSFFFFILFSFFLLALPGPWGVPVLYSLPTLYYVNVITSRPLESGRAMQEKYGDSYQFRVPGLGNGILVVSARADDVEYVLKTAFDNFPKPDWLKKVSKEVFGDGIFAVDGHDWVSQRKAASNSFRVRDIKHSMNVFQEKTRDMMKILDENEGKEVDFQTLLSSATLSMFTETAFSMQLVEVSLCDEVGTFGFHYNMLLKQMNSRVANPLWPITKWTHAEKEIARHAAFLDKIMYTAVAEARKRDPDNAPEDMLSHFLKLPNISDTYLRDILVSFLVAGRDTTSATLMMALYYLAHHPDVQERLFQECITALPDVNVAPKWKEHTDEALPYLTAVIKETLRMSPPVPSDPKMPLKDDVLPSGIKISAGSTFDWSQWALSYSKTMWDEPDHFNPSRFLPEENEGKKSVPATNSPPFIPFQYGPRTCLGMRMANATMESCLIDLVRNFEFFPTNQKLHLSISITFVSLNGVKLIAKRRKKY
jgi:cytochrome P450